MGYVLLNGNGEEFRFRQDMFPRALDLAAMYGWTPAGTEAGYERPIHDKDGNLTGKYAEWDADDYTSNARQWVTPEDAAALADALESALPFISDESVVPEMTISVPNPHPTDADMREAGQSWRSHMTMVQVMQTESEQAENEEKRAQMKRMMGVFDPHRLLTETISIMRASDFYIGMEPPTVLVVGTEDTFEPSHAEIYSGERKEYLRKFIAFCRGSGFSIG